MDSPYLAVLVALSNVLRILGFHGGVLVLAGVWVGSGCPYCLRFELVFALHREFIILRWEKI